MVSQAIGPVGFGKAESDRVDLVIELVQGAAAPFRLCTREGLAFGAYVASIKIERVLRATDAGAIVRR